MLIKKLFDLLYDWRNLPAYQLERRADIFFAIHLEKILEVAEKIKIDLTIPEFPIRIGQISNKNSALNKSHKMDYLVFSKHGNQLLFIEVLNTETDPLTKRFVLSLEKWRSNVNKKLLGATM